MKYKALIMDLDGTLVPSRRDGMPSEKVKNAVIAAGKKLHTSVASGRPLHLAQGVLRALKIDGPVVVNGGAQIAEAKSGKVLFERFISLDSQKKVYEICSKYGYSILDDREGRSDIKTINDLDEKLGKFCIEGVTRKDADEILQKLSVINEVSSHLATSWIPGDVWDIHITHKDATKKHAIEKLLKIIEVSKEETIGIGDSFNDLPLLNSVELKIVVGNAPKELKEIADYVAPSLEEDGVADAIDKFILKNDK